MIEISGRSRGWENEKTFMEKFLWEIFTDLILQLSKRFKGLKPVIYNLSGEKKKKL